MKTTTDIRTLTSSISSSTDDVPPVLVRGISTWRAQPPTEARWTCRTIWPRRDPESVRGKWVCPATRGSLWPAPRPDHLRSGQTVWSSLSGQSWSHRNHSSGPSLYLEVDNGFFLFFFRFSLLCVMLPPPFLSAIFGCNYLCRKKLLNNFFNVCIKKLCFIYNQLIITNRAVFFFFYFLLVEKTYSSFDWILWCWKAALITRGIIRVKKLIGTILCNVKQKSQTHGEGMCKIVWILSTYSYFRIKRPFSC